MSAWMPSDDSVFAWEVERWSSLPGQGVRVVWSVVGRTGIRRFAAAILLATGIHVTARPLVDEPTKVIEQPRKAQGLVDEMRGILGIEPEVRVATVVYHPLVFSVEPVNRNRDEFVLSVELGFLVQLEDDELRAALAHELGHVWIFTHHPFLQTERLANNIARPLAERSSFERVYRKLWNYEGSAGVPVEELLGPAAEPGGGGSQGRIP